MKEFNKLFGFYFFKEIKSIGFIITTCLTTLIMIGSVVVGNVFFSDNTIPKLFICDNTNEIACFTSELRNNNSEDINLNLSFKYINTIVDDVKANKIVDDEDGIVIVFNESEDAYVANVYGNAALVDARVNYVMTYINHQLLSNIVKQLNIEDKLNSMGKSVKSKIDIKYVDDNDDDPDIFVKMLLSMLMVVFIIMYAFSASSEIAYLKNNKIMEIFITSVKSVSLFSAINLVYCMIPIIQLVFSIICTRIVSSAFSINIAEIMHNYGFDFSFISVKTAVVFVLLLILGYFVFSLLNTSFISMISKPEDATVISVPLAYLALAQYFISIFAISNDDLVVKILSYIPFTSPAVMFIRFIQGNVGILEVLISAFILFIMVVLLTIWGARFFSNNVKNVAVKKRN